MRSKRESGHPSSFTQLVQDVQVGVDVEAVVIIGWVMPQVPLGR